MTLPTGVVSFLFTDIVGSSQLWEQHPTPMREAVARHDHILQTAVIAHNGHVVKMRGDGLHAVFARAQDAVAAAVTGQTALQNEPWDAAIGQIAVRMGIYSGSAQLRDNDYFGPAVNRAARLQEGGHGGQILLSSVSAGLINDQVPEGISLLDLGRYQFKDFPAPERVYQILAPGLRDRFPPLLGSGGIRTNLSAPTTVFIGREREIQETLQLLEQGRLVTLTGPGGTGKTRLAQEAARLETANFRDGVWLVELAPLTAEEMVLPAVAKVFALQPLPGQLLEPVLADFFRDKKMLLLLDNCEHLIQACAAAASGFLQDSPGLKILASSREALGVPGEMILRLPSLSLPQTGDVAPESLGRSEAVRLLIERGQAVRHDFQLTNENATAVVEICRRLDGIPLAIELAASRLRLFSPEQLAARLNDRFRLLTGGSRTALPRQQTLQALIDWSYDLLSEDEQALLRRLSVFAGGWTFDAAEAIGEGMDVLELLDQLVNKSLVQSYPTAAGIRFGYLETIRQYARDLLFAAGEGEKVRDLHFAYFANLLSSEAGDITKPYQGAVRRGLLQETENFRQAVEWEIGRDPINAVNMLFNLVNLILVDTGWGNQPDSLLRQQVRAWLDVISEEIKEQVPDDQSGIRTIWAKIHLLNGQSAIGAGELEFTRAELSQAISLARELGDEKLLMASLGFYSIIGSALGIHDLEYYQAAEEALALARKLESPFYKGVSLNSLGSFELARGNTETGQAYLAESTKIGGFINAMALLTLSMSLTRIKGDDSKSLELLREARRQFEDVQNPFFAAIATSQIGHILRHRGDLDGALVEYQASLAELHWQGHSGAVAHELECLAFINRKRGALQYSARLLGAAEALREQIAIPMLAHEKVEYDQELQALKGEMDAVSLQTAWAEGRNMGLDQAVQFALAGLP